MKSPFLIFWLSLAALLLQGCGSSGKTVRIPTELMPITSDYDMQFAWQVGLGKMSAADAKGLNIAFDGKRLFVASAAGDLMALHKTNQARFTDQVIWHIKYEARITSGPLLYDNQLFIGTSKGDVFALSADNGQIIWQTQLNSELVSLPVLADGRLLVRTNDGRVLALNALNGDVVWTAEHQLPNLFLRGAAPVLVANGVLYVGRESGFVEALSAATGEKQWEARVAIPRGRTDLERMVDVQASLVLDSGRLFVLSYNGRLVALNPQNGNFLWAKDVSGYRDFVVDRQALYVIDEDDVLRAFDLASGTEYWSQQQFKYRMLGDVQWDRGQLLVDDGLGYLHWVSPRDGHLIGRVKLANHLDSGQTLLRIARDNDQYFVLDADANISAYQRKPNQLAREGRSPLSSQQRITP